MGAQQQARGCALTFLLLGGLGTTLHAQTLPAPPVSPAPVVNYEYDAQGNVTKTVQAPGTSGFNFATTNTYDALNRQKDITDAKAGKTQFGYDGLDRTVQVTDPRNLVTQTPRNGLGDATSFVSPDTGTATNTYDAAGNLKTRTDSRGVLATYSYDALNRLTGIVYSKAGQTSQSTTWTYDQTGAGFSNGVGRLTSTSSPYASTTYAYDPQGRRIGETQSTVSGPTLTTGYEYDGAGHVTAISYPSGHKLVIAYANGLPTGISLAKDSVSTPTPLISQVQFDPFGGAKGWQWQMASGTQAYDRVRDTSGRLVRYRLGNTIRDISYDAGDRITAYTHYDATTAIATPVLDQGFGYDELGRLTSITTAGASWSIGYDANGNRTGVTLNGSTSSYTTAATSNRLTNISNPARSLGYDVAGNTVTDTASGASYTATYDLINRLTNIQRSTNGSTFYNTGYAYDAQGQRVQKKAGPTQTCGIHFSVYTCSDIAYPIGLTRFVYDQQGHLLGEYEFDEIDPGPPIPVREYAWLGDTPIAMFTPDPASSTNPPRVYFIHTDHLDTPRLVVDTNNTIRWRWLAEPFGTKAPETNPSSLGAFTQNLRFPGQYADAESGLSYNFFRDYDASMGRYVQSDPIGLAGGINPFVYVENQPTQYTDPDGLNPVLALYRAGMTGYRIGEAINPFIQPAIANALDAWLLPDPMNDSIIIAQNNKQIRKRIEGLERQIAEHKKKLDREPDCNASDHWRNEIKVWEAEVARLRLRLPNGS